ncbi:MAG: hypothetical protein LBC18_09600 [Opitutaceae bacterium]|jgi:hypothetical protein|nr:hypothetical protein [Opitutaceae bacterium]
MRALFSVFSELAGCRLCLRRVCGAAGFACCLVQTFTAAGGPCHELLYASVGLPGLTTLDHFSKRK